jgi:hypothetical protein
MPRQVETVVVDPDRVVEIQLVVSQLEAEFRDRVHPRRQPLPEVAERVAPGHRSGVQLQHAANIQRLRRGLQVQKERV